MMINVAVAITGNGGIGLKGGLPWPHLKDDMALFSKRTTGTGKNAVLMGKNTWLSIPERRRPLKNRTNIIISRNTELQSNLHSTSTSTSCHVFSSIYGALAHCEAAKYDELWIIGGGGIYNEFLNAHYDKVHRAYITYVCTKSDNNNDYDYNKDSKDGYECDTFINIPHESYLIEEKEYNPTENCYYLTCVHKVHVKDSSGMDKLEDFIKDSRHKERWEHDSNNLRI
jgi:dihydrofolate reductase